MKFLKYIYLFVYSFSTVYADDAAIQRVMEQLSVRVTNAAPVPAVMQDEIVICADPVESIEYAIGTTLKWSEIICSMVIPCLIDPNNPSFPAR